MADGTHRLNESPVGKLVDVDSLLVGGQTVERQRIVLADPVTAAALVRTLNRGVLLDEYALATRMIPDPEMLSAFGSLMVAQEHPDIVLSFHYNINTEAVVVTTANGGTVAQSNSKAVLQTSANPAGAATMESVGAHRYLPGQGSTVRFTAIFTTGQANSQQEVGLGDDDDGFFFGYQGATFGIFRRQNGVDDFIAQAAWNGEDPMDGSGPSGQTVDPTKLNVYQIRYQWLGGGAIRFFMERSSTGELLLVHTIPYANLYTVPSVYNPTMPLRAKAINTGNATNLTVQTPSMGVFNEGRPTPASSDVRGSSGNRKTGIGATETSIITLQNKAIFQGKTNRVRVLIDHLAISQGGNADCNIRMVRNTALGGVPAYTDFDTNTSVIAYDVAGTTLTGGREQFRCVQDSSGSNPGINLMPYGIRLNPGDIMTFSAQSQGGGTVSPQIGVAWREEF